MSRFHNKIIPRYENINFEPEQRGNTGYESMSYTSKEKTYRKRNKPYKNKYRFYKNYGKKTNIFLINIFGKR